MLSPTLQATVIETIQVLLSLLCAYLLLTVLKGSAVIKHKGVQLGGSAAVFVVVLVLLNRYLPDIQKGLLVEAAAAQPISIGQPHEQQQIFKVSISPAAQVITKRDLDALDRNQFFVDEELQVAVNKPKTNAWEVGRFGSIESISITDMPTLNMSLAMMTQMILGKKSSFPQSIFGIRGVSSTDIEINAASLIGEAAFGLNMLDDDQLLKNSVKSQIVMAKKLKSATIDDGDIDKIVDEAMQISGPKVKQQFSDLINASFPIKKNLKNGIFVSIIPSDIFGDSIYSKFLPTMSVLDRAVMYLSLIGRFSYNVGLENLYVDQSAGVMSFSSSVDLSNVVVKGRSTSIKLNHVDFVVAGRTRAIAVDLLYLNSDGISIFEQLKMLFDSLRFTG